LLDGGPWGTRLAERFPLPRPIAGDLKHGVVVAIIAGVSLEEDTGDRIFGQSPQDQRDVLRIEGRADAVQEHERLRSVVPGQNLKPDILMMLSVPKT
jgi:hypothetical protein